jgi:DNA-binding MarR family transcriptional regulator
VSTRATDERASAAAEAALSEALHDFFRAARRARGRAPRKSADEVVSLAQYHLLEPLLDGPLTNREVAELAGVSSPTATRMVDGLVGRELVTRIEDPSDRRAVVISLTSAGRRALSDKTREYDQARRRIASALEADEQVVAADLLRRLAEVIEEL